MDRVEPGAVPAGLTGATSDPCPPAPPGGLGTPEVAAHPGTYSHPGHGCPTGLSSRCSCSQGREDRSERERAGLWADTPRQRLSMDDSGRLACLPGPKAPGLPGPLSLLFPPCDLQKVSSPPGPGLPACGAILSSGWAGSWVLPAWLPRNVTLRHQGLRHPLPGRAPG